MAIPVNRQAHLAAIHMAQKALNLSPEDAESLKRSVTGVASAGDMTALQRRQYLAHLSNLQALAAVARGDKPAYVPNRPAQQRTVDDDQDERWHKARALWSTLGAAGQVHTNTDAALMAYVMRQTHVEQWRWLNSHQVNSVIEALKRWCRRTGVPTEPVPDAATNGEPTHG